MVAKKRTGNKRRKWTILLSILGLLIIIRLILPFVVLRFANQALTSIPGYYGHVEDIDLVLIRGAYKLNNIYINKMDTATQYQTSFFRSEIVDLSIEWKALFHGMLAGKVLLERPSLRFTKDKTEPSQIEQDSSDFRVLLDKFMPLKINRFEVNHGIIAYHDSSAKPYVHVEMTETNIIAENLKSAYDKNDVLPATIVANAYLYEGILKFNMKLNPLTKDPTYDMNAELSNTNLTQLNDFFKAYGKFDVHAGRFGLYTEMATRDRKFVGYVKPVIKGLDVVGPEDRHDNILNKIWERIVGGIGVVFRNPNTDQIATKIPIRGTINDPKLGTFDAIIHMIGNAFFQALIPAVDNDINLKSLANKSNQKTNIFKKLFSKKDKEKKKEKTSEVSSSR